MKITAILAAHNEEGLIEQALLSLRRVADEVLVGHDGPCNDRTVELARGIADKVFEFEFRGAPEANCIRLMHRATHDWVIKIDCDETLSEELIREIERIKETGAPPHATHYLAFWTSMDPHGDHVPRRPRNSAVPRRLLMFKRSSSRWIGIPHRRPEISGRAVGIREAVEHWAPHQQFSARELLFHKIVPFARVDAKIRVVYPLETYGFGEERNPARHLLRRDRLRHDFPLLSCVSFAGLSFARALVATFRTKNMKDFRLHLRWPLVHGAYQLLLGYNIFQQRRAGAARR